MTRVRAWYLRQYQRTKAGTVLASIHFAMVMLLLVAIGIWPGKDWMWWAAVPFILDFPVSLLVRYLCDSVIAIIESSPHAGFERFMLQWPEPFQSVDLFWLPALGYLILGTLWHFYWPLAIQRLAGADWREDA